MKNLILVISLISAVACDELIILNTPKSIDFKGSSDLPAESLSDVLAASLGYSVQSPNLWDGLYVKDPFNTAKTVVSFVVEEGEGLSFKNGKTFNIIGEANNFESELMNKVMEHSHLAVNFDLVDKVDTEIITSFGELKKSNLENDVKFLKPKTNRNDEEFLNEIAYLQGLIDMISEEKELPTALNVRLSFKMLSGKHEDSSAATKEASKLLIATIEKFATAIEKASNGNAVVAVITIAEQTPHSRSKRQTEENPYNLAELASKDYPVIFNIIFWFSLVMIFSLIAISLALSNVEDKDSIIYRMTGARGKKDN